VIQDQISYVRAHDGLHLACLSNGEGPIDILEIGGFGTLFPLDAVLEQRRWRRFEERLAQFSRLIKFDLRGVGYSDPFATAPTMDDYVADAIAVLDAFGLDQAVVFASSFGGMIAVELAARHPERVSRLVLANTAARFGPDDDNQLVDREAFDQGVERRAAVAPDHVAEEEQNDIDYLAPSLAGDAEVRRWWLRAARRGAGPTVADAVWEFAMTTDVRDRLPTVATPSLMIITTGNMFVPPVVGRFMADHMPNVEVCEISAADHVIWAVPNDAVVNEIERYLTGTITSAGHSRSITAVLFTDIVDSTARNTERGDRAWLELLARHDDLAQREINRRGGRLVKRLGDGLLAVFPLASDALDAGAAVARGADELGIGVRAGVHVAEVEAVGDDVLGLGVTLAARVLGQADGGEVLTTKAVVDMLAGSGRTFASRGRHELKGVAGEWELFSSNLL
jgi:pimeloyl-ACP methyl ester carboxylesterase